MKSTAEKYQRIREWANSTCTTAWKNENAKSRRLNSAAFCATSSWRSSMVAYRRCRFAFNPLGGSLVILTPFWRIATGNVGDGIDVNQSLQMTL